MKSYQQLFAELMRRQVFKVAAVYGAVAFVLLQVADLLGQGLRLPDSFLPFVTALILLGFPVALVLAWSFELTPKGIQRTGSATPDEIAHIVAQPAARRWPAGLLALVGITALVAGAVWVGRRTADAEDRSSRPVAAAAPDSITDGIRLAYADLEDDPRPSIAVLPFADMSPEGDQEYFSDGITEEISNTLAGIRELRVAGRTSAFAYKGRQEDLRQIGDELGVGYLIEGSVRKAGDRLRITAQLIDTRDGSHLWSDQYDRTMDDVFAIQTEIARAIADALRISLGLEEGTRLVTPTDDLEAYDLYLAGRAKMRERGENVFEAVRLFEAAVARDSSWAPAWAGLAESRALLPFYAPGPDEPQVPPDSAYWARSLDAAENAALHALALDPDNASATVALANVLRDRWDWDAAEATYLRALALDPDNFEAHQQYAEYLAYVGRTGDARRSALRALALDRSAVRFNVAGYVTLEDARPHEAIDYFTQGIALDPAVQIPWMRANLFEAYFTAGRWGEAREHVLGLIRNTAPQLEEEFVRTWPPGSGVPMEFDPTLLQRIEILGQSPAALWIAQGKPERALSFIVEYFRTAPPFGYSNELFDPVFDGLRDDPRFQELLASRGLAGRRPVRSTPGDEDAS
ncbi:MAG TPA: tetratricopeptide repeat protein [Gemmatimonadota bacterium]|nr:tetratricopeptide repeat protein [Gemmatimonadota bacterium]